MRVTFRNGIFETNSSMTHSLVIGTKEEFDKWRSGDFVYFDDWKNPRFITKEEKEKLLDSGEYFDREFDEYYYFKGGGFADLERDHGTFTSPSGDEMEWIAAYGYDG